MEDKPGLQFSENKIIGDYMVGRTIGKGTFGKVKIGMHKITNQYVALKILEKNKIIDQNDKIRVSRQISILRKIRHPHIIQLYQIIQTPSKLYLITEYADGGQLFELIVKNQRLDQFQSAKFLQQIINAVSYMHSLGITHRDLKPENLLLDFKKNIKVVDFGLSNQSQNDQQLKTACGSPCYAAPQMVSGKTYNGLKTDIWSCGIILYAMICGYLPFEDPDTNQLYKKIRAGQYELPNFVSLTASDLLSKILNVDPQKRPSIQQIQKHMFFGNKDIPIKGLPIKGYPFPIQKEIIKQMEILNVSKSTIEENLKNNKHNKITATFYLLLKSQFMQKGKSMMDYFREKQSEQSNNMKKQKILSKSKQSISNKDSNIRISRQLKKTNQQQEKLKSKTSKISSKVTGNKQYKHLSTQKVSRFRLNSQALVEKNALTLRRIQPFIKNFQLSNKNKISPPKSMNKKIELIQVEENQQSEMLGRILKKNIEKLKPTSSRVRIRAKSKY